MCLKRVWVSLRRRLAYLAHASARTSEDRRRCGRGVSGRLPWQQWSGESGALLLRAASGGGGDGGTASHKHLSNPRDRHNQDPISPPAGQNKHTFHSRFEHKHTPHSHTQTHTRCLKEQEMFKHTHTHIHAQSPSGAPGVPFAVPLGDMEPKY